MPIVCGLIWQPKPQRPKSGQDNNLAVCTADFRGNDGIEPTA